MSLSRGNAPQDEKMSLSGREAQQEAGDHISINVAPEAPAAPANPQRGKGNDAPDVDVRNSGSSAGKSGGSGPDDGARSSASNVSFQDGGGADKGADKSSDSGQGSTGSGSQSDHSSGADEAVEHLINDDEEAKSSMCTCVVSFIGLLVAAIVIGGISWHFCCPDKDLFCWRDEGLKGPKNQPPRGPLQTGDKPVAGPKPGSKPTSPSGPSNTNPSQQQSSAAAPGEQVTDLSKNQRSDTADHQGHTTALQENRARSGMSGAAEAEKKESHTADKQVISADLTRDTKLSPLADPAGATATSNSETALLSNQAPGTGESGAGGQANAQATAGELAARTAKDQGGTPHVSDEKPAAERKQEAVATDDGRSPTDGDAEPSPKRRPGDDAGADEIVSSPRNPRTGSVKDGEKASPAATTRIDEKSMTNLTAPGPSATSLESDVDAEQRAREAAAAGSGTSAHTAGQGPDPAATDAAQPHMLQPTATQKCEFQPGDVVEVFYKNKGGNDHEKSKWYPATFLREEDGSYMVDWDYNEKGFKLPVSKIKKDVRRPRVQVDARCKGRACENAKWIEYKKGDLKIKSFYNIKTGDLWRQREKTSEWHGKPGSSAVEYYDPFTGKRMQTDPTAA